MIALLAATLAGCTAADPADSTPDRPPATAGPTSTATTPLPTTAPATPGVPAPTGPTATDGATGRVMLFRSGGFAGRGDAVTVEPDGRWTMVDRAGSRRTGRLDPADLGRLRGLAADPRLTAEARRPTASTGCADAFSYRLTVGTVETGYVDCPADPAPPPATRALVELLLRATG
ncbi:hypothetical protein M8C17_16075 [Micromonospora sp. RHAY321]|uniref:protealysin inhibitor emfourin n=1 Tax=Micromonospora sp. RHAY321 TaxID=2944807 RepID=UPI00207C1A1B|nr:protealysin inhibitor emfourin [Micromonospora sp. RHAY321]MCO1596674.1 hypothetical protein [Micromonospora sp. RHAY321]